MPGQARTRQAPGAASASAVSVLSRAAARACVCELVAFGQQIGLQHQQSKKRRVHADAVQCQKHHPPRRMTAKHGLRAVDASHATNASTRNTQCTSNVG